MNYSAVESVAGLGEDISFLGVKQRGRVITDYFRKLSLYFFTDIGLKEGGFLFCLVLNVVWYFDVCVDYSFSSYHLYATCFYLMQKLSPSENVICCLVVSRLSPTRFSPQLFLS